MDTNERLVKVEENTKSNQHRIDALEKKVENIHELTISVKEIAIETRATREDVNDVNQRLKKVEEKPGKNWENLTKIILTRNCYSSFGLFFSKIRNVER